MPFAIAFVVGCLLMPVARRVGSVMGAIDRPDPGSLKIHLGPVSLLGGVGVTIAALIAIAIAGEASPAIVSAAACALIIGLIDDIRLLSPATRLAAIAIAGALAAGALPASDPLGIRVALTVSLALACTNAVNLVDGQDMLAGTLAAVAALGMAAAGAALDLPLPWSVGLGLGGALTAFVLWNRPPAKLFLGSCGAYAVGLLLAVQAAALIAEAGWVGLVIVSCCLAVPAFEVCSTIVRRSASGAPLAGGDRNHTYDLLSARLGSRTRATLVLCVVQIIFATLGVAVAAFPAPGVAIAVVVEATTAGVATAAVARALQGGAAQDPSGEVI